jgi:hypothetical protein
MRSPAAYAISVISLIQSTARAQLAGFAWITAPVQNENLVAGKNYTLRWESANHIDETITMHLLKGPNPWSFIEIGIIMCKLNRGAFYSVRNAERRNILLKAC